MESKKFTGKAGIMNSRVVHCKKMDYDVYIGRPSKWGNIFSIGKDGDRDEVIEKYRAWILTQPELMKALPELKGKVLGCWCFPQKCHGDVLVKMVDALGEQSGERPE